MSRKEHYQKLLSKTPYTEEHILALLPQLLPQKRMEHVLRVLDTAMRLAKLYTLSPYAIIQLRTAVLFHDFAKGMSQFELREYANQYSINLGASSSAAYHAIVGAWMGEYFFSIQDKEILDAVAYHTSGHKSLLNNKIAALLYLADYIEPGRKIDATQVEAFIPHDLEGALLAVVKGKICHVISKEQILDQLSFSFYQRLVVKRKKYENF